MAGVRPHVPFLGPRRWRGAAAALLLLLLRLASAGPLAAAPETLTVATYNVANYNVTNRRTADGFRPEYPKPEAEKAALRQVIRALDADVLVLQEVGGGAFLRELQRDLRSEGCDYPHLAILEAGTEPRHVGALSRRPFVVVREHRDLTFAYRGGSETVRRGLLELRLAAPGGEVAIFVLHLKSRFTDRADDPGSADFRRAEAFAVRDRILSVFPAPAEARFLVAGDFNDGPRSRAVRAFLERGDRPVGRLADVADSRGDRWTHHYRRDDSYSRVDHVIVSPGLAPRVAGGRIHDGPGVAEASDHRPVVVTLASE